MKGWRERGNSTGSVKETRRELSDETSKVKRRRAKAMRRGLRLLAKRQRRGLCSGSPSLKEYTHKVQTPVGMQTLIESGMGLYLTSSDAGSSSEQLCGEEKLQKTLQQIAGFLHRELPIRFAHRANDLAHAPYGLGEMPSITEVQEWYEQSWKEIVTLDRESLNTDSGQEMFRSVLDGIYTRHQDTLVTVAKGLHEFERSSTGQQFIKPGQDLSDLLEIHKYFDRFFLSRIGIRILIGHYLELFQPPRPDYVGLVCMKTSPLEVAQAAAEDARYMCERTYGDAPEVEFLGRVDLTFPYIPSHLYYILFELLKNSMRATVEEHGVADMPEVRVVIADGESNEDVVIRISDLGGGIPRSISDKVFSYLFTTARDAFPEEAQDLEDFGRENPLAGLGYGLPISRGYARYFRGDLQLMSMHGYGTDTFLHLHRVAGSTEPLV